MKAILCVIALTFSANEAPQLTKGNFNHWRSFIQPSRKDLAYTKIKWRTSLQSAVAEAKRAKKPVMLWSMNGSPIRGCT